MSLGIYARRVKIMPYSPYDFDNHVVVEIYDKKWIMLDPTTDGIFIDENRIPLSLLEIREKLANDKFVTYVKPKDKLVDLKKLKDKYIKQTTYLCKNLFYFIVDKDSTFSDTGKTLVFALINYSIKDNTIMNYKYRIKNMPAEYNELIANYKKKLAKVDKEIEKTNINSFTKSPF